MNSASAQRQWEQSSPTNTPRVSPCEVGSLSMGNNPKDDIRDPRLFAAGRRYNLALNYYCNGNGSRQAAIQNAQNAANLFGRGGDMINRQKALTLVRLL